MKKGIKFVKSPKVDTAPLSWIQQRDPEFFSQDLKFWLDVMPYSELKDAEMYVVLPKQGIIAPINRIPSDTKDFKRLTNGILINPNPYLQKGIVHYPLSAEP